MPACQVAQPNCPYNLQHIPAAARRAHTASSSKSRHRLLPPANRFLRPRRLLLRHLPRDEALGLARSAGRGEDGYEHRCVGVRSWVLWLADNRDRVESTGRSPHFRS